MERPILFSAPMVRALLDGTKTQTRRVVKLPHENPLGKWEVIPWGGPNGGRTKDGQTVPFQNAIGHSRTGEIFLDPYGQPGDRLWVRESLRFVKVGENLHEHAVYAADGVRVPRCPDLAEWCCDGLAFGLAKSVPSIHMPRWASRITLEITGVRVERLQDISPADAIAEGCPGGEHGDRYAAIEQYKAVWETINGAGSWALNPWVWAVEFKRV